MGVYEDQDVGDCFGEWEGVFEEGPGVWVCVDDYGEEGWGQVLVVVMVMVRWDFCSCRQVNEKCTNLWLPVRNAPRHRRNSLWTANQSRLMVIVRGALEGCQAD